MGPTTVCRMLHDDVGLAGYLLSNVLQIIQC